MAKNHCDTRVKSVIEGNNGSEHVVLNRSFKSWGDHIEESLADRGSWTTGRKYQGDSPAKELLKYAREHIATHANTNLADNIVSLTHPLYMHMSHMHHVTSRHTKRQADEFLDTFINFLVLASETDQVSVVLQDTLHLYASSGSLLLERGLVDQVVITSYDSGDPIKKSDLNMFKKKIVYMGGGYDDKCLEASIDSMNEKVGRSNIWGIKDLVLASPQHYDSLRVSSIVGIRGDRTISLGEAKERMGFV
jgi:hypothetical protein